MKSPACTQNKWGKGTTTDRVPDTDASKEVKARLAAVMAEREKQDCMWSAPAKVEDVIIKEKLASTRGVSKE